MISDDTDFDNDANPFASPQAGDSIGNSFQPNLSEADQMEQIRREHLSHEASIKSMGLLYLLGGGLMSLYFLGAAALAIALIANVSRMGIEAIGFSVFMLLLTGSFAALNLYVGFGLRSLNPKVHTPATVLSAIGLLGIPIGTIICGYFLYLLQSQKGKFIMSPGYRDIVQQTPHIKYRTSIVVWIFLGLLLVLLSLLIAGAVFGR